MTVESVSRKGAWRLFRKAWGGPATARELLAYGVQTIRDDIKRDAEATAQAVIDGDHNHITLDSVLSEFGLDDSFVWTAVTLAPYVTEYAKAHRV